MLNSVLFHVRVDARCDDGGLITSEVVLAQRVMLILPLKEKSAVLLTHGDQLRIVFFDDFSGIRRAMLAGMHVVQARSERESDRQQRKKQLSNGREKNQMVTLVPGPVVQRRQL